MLFRCCLLYQRESLRYLQGCTTCFTEKQRDYQLSCHSDSRCEGLTSRGLQDRIKQHDPKPIRSCSSSLKRILPARQRKSSTQPKTQSLASDSAIGLHLLQNPTCAQHYDDSRFSILAQGRSPFHLPALEASFIKTSNPASANKNNSCTA